MAKIIDGAIEVSVNAKLHVDYDTFKICMSLIRLRAKEHDVKKIMVTFDDSYEDGWLIEEIREEEVAADDK